MSELRAAIESAVKEDSNVSSAPESIPAPSPVVDTPKDATPAPAPAAAESAPSTVASNETPAPAAKTEESSTPATVATPYDKAPASWKGDAKEVWASLPEHVKREVSRREKQINSTLNENANIRKEFEQIAQVTQAYAPRIREWGTNPAQTLGVFLEADRALSSGPMESRAAKMAQIIKDYGIDFRALDAALSGSAPPPEVSMEARIEALVNQRLAPFQQRFQQEQDDQRHEVAMTIQEMAANTADYPHFEEVREEMADLIEINFRRGVPLSLQEAYNKIVGFQGYTQPAQQAAQQTQKALAASVSVGGAPATVANSGNPADLRGTILKAFEGGR
jgi:hypothetical protein